MSNITDNAVKRIVLYFTGTGNSLYVARQLAEEDTEILLMERGLRVTVSSVSLAYKTVRNAPYSLPRIAMTHCLYMAK